MHELAITRDIIDISLRAAKEADAREVRVPSTVTCRACGCTHPADIHSDASFACPQCGKTDYELHTGMEFSIDKIEVA